MRKLPIFREDLKKRLTDANFKQAWKASDPEYRLACKLIEMRLKRKLSQRELARKMGTSQAAIARIESMNSNPSLSFLKRLSGALGSRLQISI